MAVTTHLCRGNFQSSWAASGSYDFVAEALFGELDVDGFFLEFDDERSGGFEPLRFVPPGKMVVLGLVTTKVPAPKRRIVEAARFIPLDQLCLSEQYGFSSTVEGQRAEVRRGSRQARAHRQGRPGRLRAEPSWLTRTAVPARRRGAKGVVRSAECASATAFQTPYRRGGQFRGIVTGLMVGTMTTTS